MTDIQISKVRQYSSLFAVVIGLGLATVTTSVHADVMDIAPGGELTVYRVPSIFTAEGVRPIALSHRTLPRQTVTSSPIQKSLGPLLSAAAARYAIREDLLKAVAWQESHFHSDAVSPKGAVGVMQLMATTARDLGINRFDPSENVLGGAAYLRRMLTRYGGDERLALAAYNAGPGAVDRFGGVPPFSETQQYVTAITGVSPIQNGASFVRFIDQ